MPCEVISTVYFIIPPVGNTNAAATHTVVITLISFISMKLSRYIMPPEPISTAYFKFLHQ
jgi:hypothetical protein